MNEKELIKIIKTSLKSDYIGDDCAYLKDLGIVISQDSLVENVHFKTDFITPYQLGYKSIMVNISDICASGAKPTYLTISLSLPKHTDEKFVREFYEGAKDAANGVEIVGGDLTGSDRIYVSVTAIGLAKGRKISSRSNAQVFLISINSYDFLNRPALNPLGLIFTWECDKMYTVYHAPECAHNSSAL